MNFNQPEQIWKWCFEKFENRIHPIISQLSIEPWKYTTQEFKLCVSIGFDQPVGNTRHFLANDGWKRCARHRRSGAGGEWPVLAGSPAQLKHSNRPALPIKIGWASARPLEHRGYSAHFSSLIMRHSPGVSRLQDTSPHPSLSLSPHTSCFPAIFPLSARVSHLGHFLAYTDINISNRIVFFFYIILPSFWNEMLILHGLRWWSRKSTNIRSSKGINCVVWWIYNQLNLSMYSQEEKRNECPFCL